MDNPEFQKDEGYYAVTWAYDRIIKRHVVLVGGANGIIRVIDPIAKTTINVIYMLLMKCTVHPRLFLVTEKLLMNFEHLQLTP